MYASITNSPKYNAAKIAGINEYIFFDTDQINAPIFSDSAALRAHSGSARAIP